jgi:argininosuccinate synthase
MDREVMHLRDALIPKISELIYYGLWFSPEMQALKAFIEETQKGITGDVRLKLYKGNCIVSGRRSETSLYLKDLATFEREDVYDQKDAGGFIRLNALRLKIRHIGSKREE